VKRGGPGEIKSPFGHLLAAWREDVADADSTTHPASLPDAIDPGEEGQLDALHFESALSQAQEGVGRTAPNPPVGAVVAKGEEILGMGHHAAAGEAHAEVVAIKSAGEDARGATLYVTLEPCNHLGRTPPCTESIIQAGIVRVVYGVEDPNPQVSGRGLAALKEAGIAVERVGRQLLRQKSQDLIEPFATTMTRGRPWVVLKAAVSLDGRIAAGPEQRTQITAGAAGRLVHLLRDQVDAVLVGACTARVDDPQLTVRLADPNLPEPAQPLRVVLDTRLETSIEARIFAAGSHALAIHTHAAPEERIESYKKAGIRTLQVEGSEAGVSIPAALSALAEAGITSLLVEGGGRVFSAFFEAGMVDEIWWFTAPLLLGGSGVPALPDAPKQVLRLEECIQMRAGQDLLWVARPHFGDAKKA
jgi:diaminohydroxyphosphoribosylaminopyrimidine deaminase/5-amino-6-(5-phosphoribosylamino)uracil reductase